MEANKVVILNEIVTEDFKRLTQTFIQQIVDGWEGDGLYAVYLILALNRKWQEYTMGN